MRTTDNIISLRVNTPTDTALQLAMRAKQRRLDLNLTQEGLASRAGVKLATYRRFERTGAISLNGLLNIAFALNLLHEFDAIFSHRQYASIDEIINDKTTQRKRGHKHE